MTRVPFVEVDGRPYASWWRERFSPRVDPFEGLRFYQRGRANIWVGTADIDDLSCARTDAVGIHLLRIGRHLWKPTSAAIVAFGGSAGSNAIELDRAETLRFLAGDPVALTAADPRRAALSRGFVIVRYQGAALGCGEWHGRDDVTSCIPKSKRVSEIDL